VLTLDQVQAAGGYEVILVDCPWDYNDQSCNGGIGFEYPGMSLEQLAALPVPRLAAKNCSLFTWGTWPFVFECLALGRLWGFDYVSKAFDWVKVTKAGKPHEGGLGRWTRGNTEFCLMFKRGRPQRVAKDVQALILQEFDEDVLLSQRGRHSAKPPEVRERIAKLLGDVPRIELFARERVAGWDAWGNDPRLGEPDVEI
jgi:N6-adenosine-specific RNA methylase IME4